MIKNSKLIDYFFIIRGGGKEVNPQWTL